MTAAECVREAQAAWPDFQLAVNVFVDEFRRSSDQQKRAALLCDPITTDGPIEGLVAAVVSALCREVGHEPPSWVSGVASPEPFFAFPARSFALRVLLLLESPPPFRTRNVFVPESYLSRA